MLLRSLLVLLISPASSFAEPPTPGKPLSAVFQKPWQRHTIDNTSRGADGLDVRDIDGDGDLDLVAPWEEGGVIRVYFNPGIEHADKPWPQVTVGKVKSPEDAKFADLDGDGNVDVISCCEGRTRAVFVHWSPKDKANLRNASAWKTQVIPASRGQLWMFCVPMQIDGKRGIDLVIGSKGGKNAQMGWFSSPKNPRDLTAWKFHPMTRVGWVMSILAEDMDDDGDTDFVISDRKGALRGVRWLENPGRNAQQTSPWESHLLGGKAKEVMFLARIGKKQFLVPPRSGDPFVVGRSQMKPPKKPKSAGAGKACAMADIDGDGKPDLVFTCGLAGGKEGAYWFRSLGDRWRHYPISGASKRSGAKFDVIKLIDLDGDGDLDVLTCEERDNLGVIWYENPAK